MQYTKTLRAAEMMRLEIRAGGDEEGAACRKLMRWCVRPRSLRFGDGRTVAAPTGGSQSSKSGRGLPQSKTLRVPQGRWEARQVLDCVSPLAL